MSSKIAIDTETTGLNTWCGDMPFAVSMCDEEGRTWYCEWPVDPETRVVEPTRRSLEYVKRVCGDRHVEKFFFNRKFDTRMLASVGVTVEGPAHEVAFMARACDNLEMSYRLKYLADRKLDFDQEDERRLKETTVRARRIARKLKWRTGAEVEQDYWMCRATAKAASDLWGADLRLARHVCREYAVRDAERTMLLALFYLDQMDELGVLDKYRFENDELWPVTYDMETRGVSISYSRMSRLRAECERRIADAKKIVDAEATARGIEDININSPLHMARLLFGEEKRVIKNKSRKSTWTEAGVMLMPGEKYEWFEQVDDALIPVHGRTKTGQPKTDAEALIQHRGLPVIDAVLTIRANEKAISSFFDKYENVAVRVSEDTASLHPNYNQWGTLTTRYTCRDPNLQQVSDPNTTSSLMADYVVPIRSVFRPRPGCVWYCPDYDQVEVIIFADVSGEPKLIAAIEAGEDIHSATAEAIWGGKDNPRAVAAAAKILETFDDREAERELDAFNWRITELETAHDKKLWRKRAKSVTFTKIFGGGPSALMKWIQVPYDEARTILSDYDESFPDMVSSMNAMAQQAKRQGYLLNPFGTRLAVDPWDPWKIVNHVVQSTAADLMKRGMVAVDRFLREEFPSMRLVMTIHDELVFEHRGRAAPKEILREVCRLMSDHRGILRLPTPVSMDIVTRSWLHKSKVHL